MKDATIRLNELFQKYLENDISENELAEFSGYVDDPMFSDEIQGLLEKAFKEENEVLSIGDIGRFRVLSNILGVQALNEKPKRLILWPRIAAAASLLLLIGLSLFYFNSRKALLKTEIVKNKTSAIVPGGNKATLTLADGSKLFLDDAKEGLLATEGNAAIKKTKDGQIIYDATAIAGKGDVKPVSYNTISTPKGGQYAIILPDGSKVWLNAASSLRFPTVFSGAERKVELIGEGYFEVAKILIKEQKTGSKNGGVRKPFIVVTDKQEVEVLGTHFNINSYTDEPAIKTTLVEGAVRVTLKTGQTVNRNSTFINLLPGQQSVLKEQAFKVKAVNLEDAVAWKNGNFVFANENIGAVMRKIARWYDIDVEYTGNMPDIEFVGSASRSVDVKQVLRKLELTKQVHFQIEGRKIIVMP